jgi:hypothetical protein
VDALVFLVVGLLCLVPGFLTPHLRASIEPGAMLPELGKAYFAPIPSVGYGLFVAGSDDPKSPRRSRLVLYENGREIGPAHALHQTVREVGSGAYSHWQEHLYFSSSDGSDPRHNGRDYSVSAKTRLREIPAAFLILLSVGCFWMGRRNLRRLDPANLARIANALTLPRRCFTPPAQLALALAAVAVALATACLAGPQYGTNDDVGMRSIAEGIIGDGSQRQFLLFQNVLVGLVLRTFYGWAPGIPWYDLELTAAAGLGALFCQIALYRHCTSGRELALATIVSFLVFVPIFQALQFTASATLLAGGALLLGVSTTLRPPVGRLRLWASGLVIAAGLLFGCLIRLHAAFLVLIAAAPVLLLLGLHLRSARFPFLPVAALGFAVVLAPLAQFLNTAYYARSPGWEHVLNEYKQWGRATQYLHLDRSRADAFQAALSAVGWTENDYDMLSNWLVADRQRFSAERAQWFADQAPRQALQARFLAVVEQLDPSESQLGLFALLCLGPLLLRRSVPALCVALASIVGVTGSLIAAGILFKPGLLHLVWPLCAVMGLLNALLIFAISPVRKPDGSHRVVEDKIIAGAVLLGAIWLTSVKVEEIFHIGADADRTRRQLSFDMARWPARAGDTIVVGDNNFPYEIWARPFRPMPSVPWRFLDANALNATPLMDRVYLQWGTSDIAWATCHVPGVYLVDAGHGDAQPHARMLTAHLREHYGKAVEVVRVFQGVTVALYGCRVSG